MVSKGKRRRSTYLPSYLVHHVEKSKPTPDNPRITIAFNLRILTYGDEGKDQL